MKKLLIAFLTIMFFVGYVSGGEGNNPLLQILPKRQMYRKLRARNLKTITKMDLMTLGTRVITRRFLRRL